MPVMVRDLWKTSVIWDHIHCPNVHKWIEKGYLCNPMDSRHFKSCSFMVIGHTCAWPPWTRSCQSYLRVSVSSETVCGVMWHGWMQHPPMLGIFIHLKKTRAHCTRIWSEDHTLCLKRSGHHLNATTSGHMSRHSNLRQGQMDEFH